MLLTWLPPCCAQVAPLHARHAAMGMVAGGTAGTWGTAHAILTDKVPHTITVSTWDSLRPFENWFWCLLRNQKEYLQNCGPLSSNASCCCEVSVATDVELSASDKALVEVKAADIWLCRHFSSAVLYYLSWQGSWKFGCNYMLPWGPSCNDAVHASCCCSAAKCILGGTWHTVPCKTKRLMALVHSFKLSCHTTQNLVLW